jgi:hypothetical protein
VGVRAFLRQRQSVTIALACLMIVGAAITIYWQWTTFDGDSGPGNTYFTIDDGKTYFVDRATKIAPFDKDGKPAYRAHVFECNGERVVGYLSRYTAEAIKALEEAERYKGTGKPPPNVAQLAAIGTTGLQVKKPGETEWVSQADVRRATRIRVFQCPDGSTPQEVDP